MNSLDMRNVDTLMNMTVTIVTAYVGKNAVETEKLPGLIEEVFATVQKLSDPERLKKSRPRPVPAIPVEQSVTDEFIYSLEDGQPYKSLKRHLKSKYGMTPTDYREKWDLPIDYPMVSPAYARERSELAKRSGLGRSRDMQF